VALARARVARVAPSGWRAPAARAASLVRALTASERRAVAPAVAKEVRRALAREPSEPAASP
jgi:hypothetical protein